MASSQGRAVARPLAALRSRPAGLAAAALLWLFLVANFNALSLWGADATRPYSFLQRLFGDTRHAVGYQWGLAFFEAPFYALGKLLRAMGVSAVEGHPIEPALVSVGTSVYVLAAGAIVVRLLGKFQLPARGLCVATAVVGTPLLYYGLYSTGQTHAVDSLLFAAALALTYPLVRGEDENAALAIAVGAVIGLSATLRYFACFEAGVLALGLFAWRRWRDASLVLVGTAVAFGAAAAVPAALGISLNSGYPYSVDAVVVFAPLNPLRMLFTDHRGLFVWSPVALLAAVGYARMLATRRGGERRFLAIAAGMALTIVVSYTLLPWWDGTWSFSQRYYTPLFPVIAIGLGGLAEWRPKATQALASAAAAWSLFLALTLQTLGPPHGDYSTLRGSATDVAAEVGHSSLGAYAWGIYHSSRLRPLLDVFTGHR